MAQLAQRQTTLSPEEWTLVSSLRNIPSGPLRETLQAFVGELVAFVSDPHCAEAQADGVPCLTVSKDCEHCQQIEALLASLKHRIRRV